MSTTKMKIVIHDNRGGLPESPIPGMIQTIYPFFGYVIGNPMVNAGGSTERDVISKILVSMVMKKEPYSKRKVVEIDVGDALLVEDVMGD